MSYLKDYVEGKLPVYRAPEGDFIPGGNAIGVIEAAGDDVWHLKPGERVVLSSYTGAGANLDWHHFARRRCRSKYVLFPASNVTPLEGFEDSMSRSSP